jgi:Tol biopolymer transport system component/DNA-binding winged helix-turn-helix (wHTH) protein
MMPSTKTSVFRFADVEVREREFSLTKAGEVLPVEPKAFRVLLALLRNPGKLIGKEELLNAVWGDAAVTENSLARSVALLRRLLGDETRNPRYIETVATVGYRFVCPVEEMEDANGGLAGAARAETGNGSDLLHEERVAVEAVPATSQGWVGRVLGRRWLWTTVVIVVGLGASAIWYLRRPLPPLRVTEYTQITHDDRHKIPVAADGARLYLNLDHQPYSAQVAVSGGEFTPFPVALPNPFLRDVSPDGSSLLVSSLDIGHQSLWSVQIPGGSLRRLLDDGLVSSAAWSPNGKLLAYCTRNGDLNVMRGDGTESRKLVSAPGHNTLFPTIDVSWSPDGSRIRFTWDRKLWEVSSSGSGLHPLLPGWHPSEWQCCGRWTPDGRFFVFLLSEPLVSNTSAVIPAAQIWSLDERHSFLRPALPEPVQLTSGPIRWGGPVLNKDGKKIFARGVILRGELVRFDAQSRQLQPYLSGISAEFVTFSPDGKSLAYVTYPEGILWRANRDGSNPIQLTDPPIYPNLLRWSPDGRQILFTASNSEGQMKVYLLPSEGGRPKMLLPSDHRVQFDPNWSPDGRKIVFSTSETVSTGIKRSICILELSNGQVTDIPQSQDRYSTRWSPDGQNLAGLTIGSTQSLTVFDFKTQQWSDIQKGSDGFPTWSHDGKFIYFLRPVDDPGVYRIRPTGGEAERVVDLKGFRFTGVWSYWFGLDPEDTPLLLRDTGTDDIFALTLEER